MGVKSMIRNAEKTKRIELARKFLDRYWNKLTVRQVNFLSRYARMAGLK